MKILEVFGDDDYGVIHFESSPFGKMSYAEVFTVVEEKYGGMYNEEGEEGFNIRCWIFPGVLLTDNFISFINNQKDYDITKHYDWFIVKE